MDGPKLVPASDRDRHSNEVMGVWLDTDDLVTYRHFGTQSVLHDRYRATGTMPLRSDMRVEAGILLAPVAVAMLDAAGNAIDRLYHLALTQIDINVFEAADEVRRLKTTSTVVREARTQLFTEARFEDQASGRMIGFGTANWSVINVTPEGFVYSDPGPGPDDGPSIGRLTEIFEAQPGDDGGYVIESLSPRIGTDTLHHGPMLVTMEMASLDKVRTLLGHARVTPTTFSARIVRAGRKGPFVTTSTVLARSERRISCRAEMVDQGREGGEVIAIALWQCEVAA